LIPSIGM